MRWKEWTDRQEAQEKEDIMEKNRGFSLVELLVTIAILSVVMAIAFSFMVTGSRSFTKGNADASVQKEAELTVNQIEDMIIDLNGGVSMSDDGAKTELSMYHAEDDGSGSMVYSKSAVRWDKSDQNVYCSKWDVSYDASTGAFTDGSAEYADQLLAEHVTDFQVDLSDTLTTKAMDGTTQTIVKSVLVSVGYDNGTGLVDYATSPVITLRNRMLLSDNPANIFDEPKPAADTMALYYKGDTTADAVVPIVDRVSEVNAGSDYNVYAKISTTNATSDVNELVSWTIEEAGTASTIDATGYLRVGAAETNPYLTITAVYKSNPNKKATGVVKVVGGLPWLFNAHIATVELQPFAPKYEAKPKAEGFVPDSVTYHWEVTVAEGGRELSDVVNPFSDTDKTLRLDIKKDEANFGRVLVITLEATAHATKDGVPVTLKGSDQVRYRIDTSIGVDGDSYMQRGKLVDGTTHWGLSNDETAQDVKYTYECYFCSEDGKRISKYDPYLTCLELEPLGDWGNGYRFGFKETLPLNQEFYVKVTAYYEGIYQGMSKKWQRERIHYIPAVQIYGGTVEHDSINAAGWFTFTYRLVGYYADTWANTNPPVYEYEIVDFVCDAPEGVFVTPKIQQTLFTADDIITVKGSFEGADSWKAQPKSLTIRVSAKKDSSINTLVTINFRQP